MTLNVVLFTLLLPLISGMQITRVRFLDDVTDWATEELEVEEGARLLIPCMFFVDDDDISSHISLEWGMKPSENSTYRPIIHLNDTSLLPVKRPNTRAQVNINLVREGRCSLIIDPVIQEDRGQYELHLAIDNVPYEQTLQILVQVSERQFPVTTSTSFEGRENETSNSDLDDISDEKPVVRPKVLKSRVILHPPKGDTPKEDNKQEDDWIAEAQKTADEGVKVPYVAIIGGVILLLLIVGFVAASCCRMWYKKQTLKKKDQAKAMEEGLRNEEPNVACPLEARPPIIVEIPETMEPPLPLRSPVSCPSFSTISYVEQEFIVGKMAETSLKMLPGEHTVLKQPKKRLKHGKHGKKFKKAIRSPNKTKQEKRRRHLKKEHNL